MPVDPKYIVSLKGKAYPTFPGVLDHAFHQGLYAVHTNLVQIPGEENGMSAIVTARALFRRDGELFEFHGLGDAAPNNVGPHIVTALVRMAETRAIGRALRMGTNIGETMYEELPPEKPERDEARPEEAAREHAKKRKRYDDLRAEMVSYGMKDPGKLSPKATTVHVEAAVRGIWPAIVAERKKREHAPEPAPASEPAPAKPAPGRAQLLAGWERLIGRSRELGLVVAPLPEKASPETIKARGKSLAETVKEVEENYALLDALLTRMAELGRDEGLVELDRTKTDPYQLAAYVKRLAEKIGQAEQETALPGAAAPEEEEVDPFAEANP